MTPSLYQNDGFDANNSHRSDIHFGYNIPTTLNCLNSKPAPVWPSSFSDKIQHEYPSRSIDDALCPKKMHDAAYSMSAGDNIFAKTAISPTAARFGVANRKEVKSVNEERWNQRIKELRLYKKQHGDTLVPHTYPPNMKLGRWVKRQRRQYKLMLEGKTSSMNAERAAFLEEEGFVWDSHQISWKIKLSQLRHYKEEHGDCLVPSNYLPNTQLGVWVKCQRQQYKLFCEGKPSSITKERIDELEAEGFEWNVRSGSRKGKPTSTVTKKRVEEFERDDHGWIEEIISAEKVDFSDQDSLLLLNAIGSL